MNKIFFFGFLIVSLFLAGCTSTPHEKSCLVAADCVPAACCHATDAVNSDYKPGCSDLLCTAACEPGTLDCGQGEIECVRGECVVVLTG